MRCLGGGHLVGVVDVGVGVGVIVGVGVGAMRRQADA